MKIMYAVNDMAGTELRKQLRNKKDGIILRDNPILNEKANIPRNPDTNTNQNQRSEFSTRGNPTLIDGINVSAATIVAIIYFIIKTKGAD